MPPHRSHPTRRPTRPGLACTLRTALSTTLTAAALLGLPAAASGAGPEVVEELADAPAVVSDLSDHP